jgi:hypothetical protein
MKAVPTVKHRNILSTWERFFMPSELSNSDAIWAEGDLLIIKIFPTKHHCVEKQELID